MKRKKAPPTKYRMRVEHPKPLVRKKRAMTKAKTPEEDAPVTDPEEDDVAPLADPEPEGEPEKTEEPPPPHTKRSAHSSANSSPSPSPPPAESA